MRIEGLPRETWEPEAARARQNYQVIAERAQSIAPAHRRGGTSSAEGIEAVESRWTIRSGLDGESVASQATRPAHGACFFDPPARFLHRLLTPRPILLLHVVHF